MSRISVNFSLFSDFSLSLSLLVLNMKQQCGGERLVAVSRFSLFSVTGNFSDSFCVNTGIHSGPVLLFARHFLPQRLNIIIHFAGFFLVLLF